ncbi:TPA: hypothetical protein QH851_002223 [Enterobacter asburiae]|uniref:Uncharacterized protein n=1 Tax=Enterobacter genomosp. O TaxID=2364150 RepID=A0A0X4ECH2_9ENTR|nr:MULTISPECIES: hypothetical protein [Enterobacter cloacae complex]KUQ79410.1 hypothetical protein AWI28_08675 [Enterobacter genomosp. O]KZQ38500.1 hypothetical protein A3464_18615 [Enterobacter genomosp. O]MCM7108690.1 hypothetical protein [Enterobacter cloacae]HDS9457484.1 hypothetical protein [Enterobacter asburiae]
MIKNLVRIDQLSVRFIKWGKTIIYKGDYLPGIDASRFFIVGAASGNWFDIIMLNNRYQTGVLQTKASAFRRSRVPVLLRALFFHFPLDSMIFFRLFSKHATSVAASLGRSGR